ncbi:pantetheine-phosphate adenylyltransferase [Friedmanniella endophytica]|uniref:Phosphopantetheine adenylyltransferase n=1 Tax=Microlunatus kandeliicorticis TaxID=1759536 RepID=A0A7W3IW14_9ACTN|nr:pantetheine-phosphate adenylyltransferase [Microlunatus kandeliicorticis]MBA8796297.1 pantetheine-phosphate adenylyltransferase [Microlunatus kandeliicorticis]
MARAVCPGSFDPITRGHLDVIGRAARQFDEVLVAVGRNAGKRGLFDIDERVAMVAEACADWPTVRVEAFDGLLAEFCAARDASCVVKGVRSAADYDYELPMARMNARLTGVETLFLPAAPEWSFVSSSLVREVAALGGDVTPYLTPAVAAALADRLADRHGDRDTPGGG